MDIIHIEKCPVCGGTHIEKVGSCTDHYATGERFELWACRDCRFRFTQDFPDESVNARYYDSPDYISHSNTNRGLMNKVYHVVRSFMLRRKRELVKEAANCRRGKLLDIGAGTGFFAHTMQQSGWTVTAAERNAKARDFGKNELHLNEVIDSEDISRLPDGSFDVVTMWHVMEHVQHLDEEWQQLHRLLREDGTLVVAVPNFESADSEIYGEYWAAYDVPRHLWHFNVENLRHIAMRHGFKLIDTHAMPMDAFYIAMLSEKYAGHSHTFARGAWAGLKCYFLAGGRPERSSSVIYVLKKKKQ